jgi:hypothetical protein
MPVNNSALSALFCLTSLAGAGAAAATPPSDEGITVTAPRLTDEQVAKAARTYADNVLPPTPLYGQFARWQGPVCIKVSGIDPTYAPRIAARITAAATAAGVKLAPAGCTPNLLVAFTLDAKRTVSVITARMPRTLAKLTDEERRAVKDTPLPVRWWYYIKPTDRSGVPAGPSSRGDAIETVQYNSSLIDTNLIASVNGAVAVVDVPLATGTDLDALGDYIALVTLAPTRLPPQSPGVPSILDLFRADSTTAPPATLSEWDTAFMAGLYKSVGSRRANWQRGQIVEHMKDASEP